MAKTKKKKTNKHTGKLFNAFNGMSVANQMSAKKMISSVSESLSGEAKESFDEAIGNFFDKGEDIMNTKDIVSFMKETKSSNVEDFIKDINENYEKEHYLVDLIKDAEPFIDVITEGLNNEQAAIPTEDSEFYDRYISFKSKIANLLNNLLNTDSKSINGAIKTEITEYPSSTDDSSEDCIYDNLNESSISLKIPVDDISIKFEKILICMHNYIDTNNYSCVNAGINYTDISSDIIKYLEIEYSKMLIITASITFLGKSGIVTFDYNNKTLSVKIMGISNNMIQYCPAKTVLDILVGITNE